MSPFWPQLRRCREPEHNEGKPFAELTRLANVEQAVWSGWPSKSNQYTAVVNLKNWAAAQREAASKETGEKVSGVVFRNGFGIAQLPENEQSAGATGVIANVIRVRWKGHDGKPFDIKTRNGEVIRFCLGSVILVGRRIKEPLWRGDAMFLARKATGMIDARRGSLMKKTECGTSTPNICATS